MIYAQIKSGRKLHLACQAGEEWNGEIVRAGSLSRPICGQHMEGNYRMTINVPLGNACKKCRAASEWRKLLASRNDGQAARRDQQ